MRVPLRWIKEYVDFEDSIQGLSDKLTFSGLEVEGIETIGSDYAGLVVAEIKAVNPHPNADKLTLCTVFDGTAEWTVVCGAPNVRVGLKGILAPVGSTLPGGFEMKRAKIRGVESLGMLCAEDELGLSKDHAGIMDLDPNLVPGTPAAEILPKPDVVFELEVTPNRPDSLSIYGIAREIAALYGQPLKPPAVSIEESPALKVEDFVQVEIADPENGPRYTGRYLDSIVLAPSPDWMQNRLNQCGVRPINNVVDITNYVMLELGQPLHAFDYRQVAGGKITVRAAAEGETMETLDGKTHELQPHHLLITDAEKPVALAGVMGGANSEIADDTSTVLLESAMFSATSVRRTARELDTHTESSYRFARGGDIGGVDFASRRATHLLQQLAQARLATGVVDVYPNPQPLLELPVRWQTFREVSGIPATRETITHALESIALETVAADEQGATFRIPSFRRDLEREIDLVEEFARLHGLDKIPTPEPQVVLIDKGEKEEYATRRAARNTLCGLGLQEVVHYSLTAPRLLDLLHPEGASSRIVLPNPISQDQAVLRTSLIPQMVETLGRNKSRQVDEAAFFELGKVFEAKGEATSDRMSLAIGLMGPVNRSSLDKQRALKAPEMAGWIKGLVEQFLAACGVTALYESVNLPPFEPGQCAQISLHGNVVGYLGILAGKQAKEWRFSGPVALAELKIDACLKSSGNIAKAIAPPTFPSIGRDNAFIVDRHLTHAAFAQTIQKQSSNLLESFELFDVFEGGNLGEGKKSLAYRFIYRHKEKTLTDEVVNKQHEKMKRALCHHLNAQVVGEEAPQA